VSAVTSLTVQSHAGVVWIEPVSARVLRETLELLRAELSLGGVKIGMLGTGELVGVVAEFLRGAGIGRQRVVLDPVIRASSGAELLDQAGVRRLVEELLPLAGWVTPNVDEAGALLGRGPAGREEVPEVARRIQELGDSPSGRDLNVVITGGHLDPPDDFLLTATGEEMWIPGTRAEVRSRHGAHGTGCVFASALLCRLLTGEAAADAVREAKAAVVRRLGTP